jgi:hypothetical protein
LKERRGDNSERGRRVKRRGWVERGLTGGAATKRCNTCRQGRYSPTFLVGTREIECVQMRLLLLVSPSGDSTAGGGGLAQAPSWKPSALFSLSRISPRLKPSPLNLKTHISPRRNAPTSRKRVTRSSPATPATAGFGNKPPRPSRSHLAAAATAIRQFSDDGLIEMRRRFVVAGEARTILQLLDAELQRRGCNERARTR